MKTIWKFETPFESTFKLDLPEDARILCVQRDKKTSIPCIWVLLETNDVKVERQFILYGTGHSINTNVEMKYIGTYQYQNGEFVGHLFERIKLIS